MTITLFNMPDDPQELAPWLERQIAGPTLRELIQELLAFGADANEKVTLESLIGGRLSDVLSHGLRVLPLEIVRQVLGHPLTLLELQEHVLFSGGEYWETLAAPSKPSEAQPRYADDSESSPGSPKEAEAEPMFNPTRVSRRSLGWGAVGMAAAALVLGLTIWTRPPTPAGGWGFDRPGALAVAGTPDEYLTSLCQSAAEWFRKRPETREALEQRIVQFRRGCQTLLQAPHRPLSPEQKTSLANACAATIAELDNLLTRLRSGRENVLVLREDSDRVIRTLIGTLQTLAERAAT